MVIGRSGASGGQARPAMVLLLGTMLLSLGCSNGSYFESMIEDFPKRKSSLEAAKAQILSLKEKAGLISYSRVNRDTDQVVMNDLSILDVREHLDGKLSLVKSDLVTLKTLLVDVGIESVEVVQGGAVFIVMRSGGTLGSDLGYLYGSKSELAPFSYKGDFVLLSGELKWYAVYR